MNRYLFVFLFILMLLFKYIFAETVIEFPEIAYINKYPIRLCDIAKIHSDTVKTTSLLENLLLINTPSNHQTPLFLNTDMVKIKLDILGIDVAKIKFKGAKIVKIVYKKGVIQKKFFSSKKQSHSLRRHKITRRFQQAKKIQYTQIPVFTKDIPRNTVITKELLTLKKFPNVKGNVVKDINFLIGKTTRRFIPANTPILPYFVQETPVVKKGQIVKVIFKEKDLIIEAYGKARKSGIVGDIIPIENPKTRKVFYGKVESGGLIHALFNI